MSFLSIGLMAGLSVEEEVVASRFIRSLRHLVHSREFSGIKKSASNTKRGLPGKTYLGFAHVEPYKQIDLDSLP